jgi:hypothetical protein
MLPATLPRRGLRICGARGNSVVRRALVRYARWLRVEYEFPIRVPVYLFPSEYIITREGQQVTASFFAPFSRSVEPYVRIATGDYAELSKQRGRDSAIAAYMLSLNHELTHYWQWIETGKTWEKGVVRRASAMLRRYEASTRHP